MIRQRYSVKINNSNLQYFAFAFQSDIMIYNYYYNVELLSGSKVKTLSNKINKSLRKFRELLNFIIDESLLEKISSAIKYFEDKVKLELKEFTFLSLEHMKAGLFLTPKGILCLKVYQKLLQIGNKTTLLAVMRGLLDPLQHRQIEKFAIETAENETKIFVEDVNFLFSVIAGQRPNRRTVRRYKGKILWFLKENIDKILQAKIQLKTVMKQK